jgi:hypothetical protein
MTVTRADFLMHGRLDNFRARLTTLLVELDKLIRGQMEAANQEKLGGSGTISYGTIPPTWNLAWKSHGRQYDATLMAFQQGGAFVVHGRLGLNRPFRNDPRARDRDIATVRQEIVDQIVVDETVS